MNVDSHYEKGHSHLVCQDYALHEKIDEFCFVVISDGCSSSTHVDFGARILCHIVRDYLLYYYKTGVIEQYFHRDKLAELFSDLEPAVIKKCLEIKSLLNLRSPTFDATLLIAIKYKDSVCAFGRGDGAIIIKYKDSLYYDRAEFESGAPFYISYKMSQEKTDLYTKEFPGGCNRKIWIKKEGESIFKLDDELPGRYTNSLHYNSHWDKSFGLDEDDDGNTSPIKMESISVCSDGMFSFFYNHSHPANFEKNNLGPYDHNLLIPQFVDFKNHADNFLKRRMKRMETEIGKIGIFHDDDLSIGTIVI